MIGHKPDFAGAFKNFGRLSVVKFIRTALPLVAVFLFAVGFANAQSGLDVYFGVGTATASSSGTATDTFGDGNIFLRPRWAVHLARPVLIL
jgi:hypothetical protein